MRAISPIVIAGSGRSGTTWIGDVISAAPDCWSIFEPMHPGKTPGVPAWAAANDLPGPYLRARDEHPEWKRFFTSLLDGTLCNHWTRQDWRYFPAVIAKAPIAKRVLGRAAMLKYHAHRVTVRRPVIKAIRANLALPWLETHLGARIVYLLRHPCAVVGSRLRLSLIDSTWDLDRDATLSQSALMADFLDPYRDQIVNATSALEQQAVLWCIENVVAWQQQFERPWLTGFYEEFVANPDAMFAHTLSSLHLRATSATRRAQRTWKSNPGDTSGSAKPWHHPLSEADGEEVLRICRRFGLDMYGRQTQPLVRSRFALPQKQPSATRLVADCPQLI